MQDSTTFPSTSAMHASHWPVKQKVLSSSIAPQPSALLSKLDPAGADTYLAWRKSGDAGRLTVHSEKHVAVFSAQLSTVSFLLSQE